MPIKSWSKMLHKVDHRTNGLWRYNLIYSLFAAGRMGTGATIVIFMLANGSSLADIAAIKLVQGVVILLAEIPTGLIADLYGRKKSVLAACFSAILSFAAYYFGRDVPWFYAAEILNALAISFWSGAFNALVVDNNPHLSRQGLSLDVVFSRMATFGSIATMLGGFIGGLLATKNLGAPFLFASAIMILTALSLGGLVNEDQRSRNEPKLGTSFSRRCRDFGAKIITNVKISIKEGFASPRLRPIFLLQIASQFALQPVFHYWQPYFNEFNANLTTGDLGTIFLAYVGVQALYLAISSQIMKRRGITSETVLLANVLLMTVSFGVMSSAHGLSTALPFFLIMQGANASFQALIGSSANKHIPSGQRATILSSISFVSRIGMLGCLTGVELAVEKVGIQNLYWMSFAATLAMLPLLFSWQRTNRVEEHSQMRAA